MSTLQAVELGVLGPLQVRRDGAPVLIPGAKPRAILTMLGLHGGSVVSADTLLELLWGGDPPRTAAKALQTHISALRRALGDGFVLTEGTGWILSPSETDASRYRLATRMGRDAAAAGDTGQAVPRFEEALTLWRGTPELPDTQRGISEKTRWIEGHAALIEDRADALLATGRAAEIIGELEAGVAEAPLRERRWGQLILALYRAGRQGEALAAYQRARTLLADELGVDPGPELRRLEAAVVAQDPSLEPSVTQQLPMIMRAVTFLLTDIEGSTAAWEANADAMARALARHDELVEQVVTSRGGRLIKTRGEGDATFSVFDRPSGAAAAAMELQDAIVHEPWALLEPMRIRIALHTGEAELRDGDYFGRAVNRAARLRSLAAGGQILCSGATAELVIDSLPEDVLLADLGMRHLKNLARPEHVFELRLQAADDSPPQQSSDEPFERPALPAVLTGPGPFVGRAQELERLLSAWQTTLSGGMHAVLIAGEPGVGKTRLGGEWSQQAYRQGAVVLYGRCDEDLGAPYQPFTEALRSLVPCIGASRLRGLRGVEALLTLVPGLSDVLPDLAAPTRADPDTERYALFDAVVAVLEVASTSAPIVLVLDDLHWAAKPTLLLLRHLLRFGDQARVQIVGTYRSTDLDRSHPLAAMLADLHRDGTADRINLSGLDERDVTAYVSEAGYDDEELANALAMVTGGNPFFLIEALRHVEESGGTWDPSTLPQGVREAVSRRLSRLPAETNKALAAAAVVGSRFAVDLVEQVVDEDLVDAFDEACKAGIIIEEPGGRYRFNHAIVRQSLIAELASVRRMRLHQRIATTLEAQPGSDDERLAELAHHYFECAWAGNAAKAVEYCRRAADQAMARLAYEGAADLYDRALHAMEELDDELPDRDDQAAELLVARCEALLAAGDVVSAAGAVSQLQAATVDSARLAAWATCFDGQLSMLIHPERLDEVEAALDAAAQKLAGLDDAAGEAKAHTVRATCLARLGRIADCEVALDEALTAARRAGEHRRVNAVLANAPLAALWGPNPVPRAGGRCLDVVRLLRITMDSPAVEATSTRCQAVLEAFRGRAAAARRMIDSARRTVTELGLRHALLEVEQFAGIVELIADDPAAAEPHLRQACSGFRRMGLDADTAETAALLGRACLALGRDADADELCLESERLAGHALKASIAWRTLRAHLLSRGNDHDEARRVAEAAVGLAERTDALVDHGDACLTLATVLAAASDVAGARAAAERAASLYERKGAVALAERARRVSGERDLPPVSAPPERPPAIEFDTACVRVGERVAAAINRGDWDEFERLFAPEACLESRRKVVGFTPIDIPFDDWQRQNRRILEAGETRIDYVFIAVRGERLALSRCSVGTTDASPGAPIDELLQVYGIDEEGRVALQIWFDVEDMDAAIAELDAVYARFERERSQARRLENTATRVFEKEWSYFAARDWDALADTVADSYSGIDHRRVVNAENQHGRDAVVKDLRVAADVGFTISMVGVVAIRGERLALTRVRASGADPEAIQNDALNVIEIDADERILAAVTFDLDDFDAAFEELDARYLAGDAAAFAQTWSIIANTFVAHNRREIVATTPDAVSIDHRRVAAFAPGEGTEYLRAGWDLGQTVNIYIETAHRLNDLGGVFTWTGSGTSHEGFDAEWRGVELFTVEADLLNRIEVFDEADLDAAIARFVQLGQPAPRLENGATHVYERMWEYFRARDWVALTGLVADDELIDDRRRVVNSGVRQGRNAGIQELQAAADIGFAIAMVDVMAIRGDRLALTRVRASGRDPDAIQNDVLQVVEIGAAERITTVVTFDLDDFDAALAELDARYMAGEAAAHAGTWSVVSEAFVAHSRREVAATTPDAVSIDHRRVAAYAPGEAIAYIHAGWDLGQNIRTYIDAVHRLDNLGAVITYAAHGSSQVGFDAEWRGAQILTVDGDMVTRSELFDEDDLEAALARFEELRPAPRLENPATRTFERLYSHVAAGDWDAVAQITADNVSVDDRRRVVNAGILHGRDANIKDAKATADVGFTMTMLGVLATRGGRIALTGVRVSGRDPEAIQNDALQIVEIDAEERIASVVVFDLDDFDAAIAELDARYVVGEAAAHAHTWTVIAKSYASVSRHEFPAISPNSVFVDHRRAAAFGASDLSEYLRAGWDLGQTLRPYIEAEHRLSDFGAVCSYAAHGVSREGFDAEWQGIDLVTVDGDMIARHEFFDEVDLDAAIARFEELSRPTRQLENAASQLADRFVAYLSAGDWDTLAEMLADNFTNDDRRRVVGSGVLNKDAQLANTHAIAELWSKDVTSSTIATRGERLVLLRLQLSDADQGSDTFLIEVLGILEIGPDDRMTAFVTLDVDDFDAAIAELDARYLAGEAAAHAHTWSVVTGAFDAINRRELPRTTPDWVNIDHRRGTSIAPGEMPALLDAAWNVSSDLSNFIEEVHRLDNRGAVITHVANETSQEGFHAQWRVISLLAIEGDLVNRCEVFDEADQGAAIARFDQLSQSVPRLENTASQAYERFRRCFGARDWAAMAELLTADTSVDDHRRVVNAEIRRGRDVEIANMRAFADIGAKKSTATVIAIRGEHLVLCRTCVSGEDEQPGGSRIEMLNIVETTADKRILARVAYDPDDFEAALAELDARYVAGEAAACSQTWSTITRGFASLNRGELPAVTQDWANDDHRHVASMARGEGTAYFRASWELAADLNVYIEAVHRLSDLGAVFTHVGKGTSRDGFDAEWRTVDLMTVDGDLISRGELFDEADVDAAIARFEDLSQPAQRLENAAAQSYERIQAHFAARDWDAMAETLADEVVRDDRRRVVGAERRKGRDAVIAEFSALAEIGVKRLTFDTIAIRGSRLILTRSRASGRDPRADAFRTEVLSIAELDADERTAAIITFDPDDFDAAIAELDARYLAGEAAACSQTWSVIADAYAALNRHEFPATAPDWVSIDHRGETMFGPGDLIAYLRARLDFEQDFNIYTEAVHRLTGLGAVVTYAAHATSQEGFEAEWRGASVFAVEGDMVNRWEVFDEADLDTAIARFEQLSQPAPLLKNTASQVGERFLAHFAARAWDAMAEILADNYSQDDRRRVVGAGVRDGRDAQISDMRTIAGLHTSYMTSTVMATRGERLALMREGLSFRDQGSEGFLTDVLVVLEINADEQIVGSASFDVDDLDAAIAELDTRYLAGEGAAHAHVWSVIAGGFGSMRRYEVPPTTPDCVSIDHRRTAAFAPGELNAYFRAAFDLTADIKIYVEAVHRLNDLGVVCTHVVHGVSHEGFAAEWREVDVLMVEGNIVNRAEIFDEADVDAAFAKFDELSRSTPRLKNAVADRFLTHFAARDWDALAQDFAENYYCDDRRRVVNAGLRQGRHAAIEDLRVAADIGLATNATFDIIATRGQRHILTHWRGSGPDRDAIQQDVLQVVEHDADGRIAAAVLFDVDDVDTALTELDARYLVGETSAHADVWSLIVQAYTAVNRHELPPTTPDWVNIDHRRGRAFAPGDLAAYLRATWDLAPDVNVYVEAVHRLSNLGGLVTHCARGSSQEGFDAEWREVILLTFEAGMVNHFEVFDEADLDPALARFEELQPQTRRLENAVSRVYEHYKTCFAERDWAAMARILAEDIFTDDRRRVVNAGVLQGRDVVLADMRALAEVGANITSAVIAAREEHLVLCRVRFWGQDRRPQEFIGESLSIIATDADDRITAGIVFDPDDIDAAIEELDARYLAGEAGAHAHTWSVVASSFAPFNRHEVLAADWVTIDHRQGTPFEPSDMTPSIRTIWDLTPNLSIHIEAVHRLNNLGAVITHEGHGTSQEGFDAEWRAIDILMVDGDSIIRCEVFDETDLDAAIERFEQLGPQAPRLENAAIQVDQRFWSHYSARDWDAMAELLADEISTDDRRRVVNAGARQGRDGHIAEMRAVAEVGTENVAVTVMAIRGARLALTRIWGSTRGTRAGEFSAEVLNIVEIDAENRISARVAFDADDIDDAFAELDARYLADEAAAHAHIWTAITKVQAAYNRHEVPPTTADCVNIDHRPGIAFAPGDVTAYIGATYDVAPNVKGHLEAVHRLGNLGVVVTEVVAGTSQGGFAFEWREVALFAFEGDMVSRFEIFDEADLDAALARFDELDRPAPRLENAATRSWARSIDAFNRRDMADYLALMTPHGRLEDQRKGLRGLFDGSARRKAIQELIEESPESWRLSMEPIAIRGSRLSLTHECCRDTDTPDEPITVEVLTVIEVVDDDLIHYTVSFDPDDIEAAFEELDTRYLAGEAAAYSETWLVIAEAYAALNRGEMPVTTSNFVDSDHRSLAAIGSGDLMAYLRTALEDAPQSRIHIEAVHRLTDLGAVITHVAKGMSREGFDAEWRITNFFTVAGDLINRCEIFDEADLDAALARFDELDRQIPKQS